MTGARRDPTLSSLGRAPARAGRPSLPPPPEPRERGTIGSWVHGALFDNVGLKFLSMVLAITVFLLVNTDRDREISARVGVSYTLPDDKVLVSDRLEEVHVTIKGPWRLLRRFDERQLDRINLDLRRAPAGEIAITPDMVHLPEGLQIESISPRSVRVAFERRVEKVVEVTPRVAGRPLHGYVITEVKAAPATIKVRGAESTMRALSTVRTQEVSVEGRADSFIAETEAVPPDGVELEGDSKIVLHVTVDEELVTHKLPGLTVALRGDGIDPARWKILPAQVDVTLTGALLAVEKAQGALAPVIKLAPGDTKAREIDVSVEGLPPGIGVKVSPDRVRVEPVR